MMIAYMAGEYLEAAKITNLAKITNSQNPDKFAPTYFLVCRSLELSLKAFLRGSGHSVSQLRNIQHDLDKCAERAIGAALDRYVSLSESDRALIRAANVYYKSKDFEYTIAGYKPRRPCVEPLIQLAERVSRSLLDFCANQRKYHFGKPTAAR